jgi:ribosome-binding factor A
MSGVKTKRIASSILKEVSDILANEANDSLLKTITLTGCEVSSDVSYAKIFFTSFSDLSKDQLEEELEEASGYIRTKLANVIELRHTPVLNFKYDTSVEYGNRIEEVINEIHQKEN